MKPTGAETAQDPFELTQLLALCDRLNPERILEVGVWHGGTLWHWLQGGRTVVGIDNTMFEADDWQRWAQDAGSELTLLQADSHDQALVEQARGLGTYDLVFIDAGHDYESVKADWENYGPMCSEGGIVVFHDIAERPDYGVSRLWAEIKPGRRTVEINGGVPAYCGIGVVFV